MIYANTQVLHNVFLSVGDASMVLPACFSEEVWLDVWLDGEVASVCGPCP
jgi:hypothetical protein